MLINTCLFSEPHEQDVLYVKLVCESPAMDEWIFIQSPYSFRGEYKGACLEEILQQDRFSPFKDRIHIITINENLFERVGREHAEKGYFQVEHASRMSCSNYIFEKYPNNTRVIVSDVDEILDLSHAERRAEFFRLCAETDNDLNIPQLKYWFGYANLSCYPKELPVRTISSLKTGWKYFRNEGCQRAHPKLLLSVEYAYSFDLNGNMRKCSTFSHDRYKQEHLEKAFFFNTWHKRDHERLGQAWDFFERIELTEHNSPQYVLEHFDELDPNVIHPNYAEHRKQYLGMNYPHPCEQQNLLMGNKIDRNYHFLRKN